MSELRRDIEIHPAENHQDGSSGFKIYLYLKGDKGAVQFAFNTSSPFDKKPYALDLGYHSKTPMYEDQTPVMESCNVIGGCRCFYDGSTSNADRLLPLLMEKGSDSIWEELEKHYKRIFEEGNKKEK